MVPETGEMVPETGEMVPETRELLKLMKVWSAWSKA
jgi:hypothetical protein